MSDKQDDSTHPGNTQAPDEKKVNVDDLYVQIGKSKVPFSKISKPHSVVLNPNRHKEQVDPKTFPGLTEEAKAREAEREKEKSTE